jgi:hypothetical protein
MPLSTHGSRADRWIEKLEKWTFRTILTSPLTAFGVSERRGGN